MDDQVQANLALQAANDQRLAEIADTAGRTAMYFKLLVNQGMPVEWAAQAALEYNQSMLTRHFYGDITRINGEDCCDG